MSLLNSLSPSLLGALALAPAVCMGVAAATATFGRRTAPDRPWRGLPTAAALALGTALLAAALTLLAPASAALPPGLQHGVLTALLAALVQLLGTVIAAFSARYLDGEPGAPRYAAALATVLAAVQVLLLADHWLVLIGAWAVVGIALERLLCFYAERPFARLAAHKKHVADRAADLLLLSAAGVCWAEVGSGNLSALAQHLADHGASPALQFGAVCLVLAVALRTALLPVHGWLIQVMEAPTPVSALLHAGVVNLGGFVLIRFAPLLEAAPVARWMLVALGLATALLAGMVMLTRISIKVRLAWSTVAQMGFMVLECGLGLYTLAALHLIGHSLYKAHAFLRASSAVRDSRLQQLREAAPPSLASLALAPLLAAGLVAAVLSLMPTDPWPLWWSAALLLAWSPLLWTPSGGAGASAWIRLGAGALSVVGLTALLALSHALPLGVVDRPFEAAGRVALAGLALLYLALAMLHAAPARMERWRRWSYAGFYLDDLVTRAVLRVWPTQWAPAPRAAGAGRLAPR